jgi:hypothetical protein
LKKLEAQYRTLYEKYIQEEIAVEKTNLDRLYSEFAKSNSIGKEILKRRIDETLQNIELLQKELEKYGAGLSWLREPSKERDEKAEHLEKIQEEPKPAATPSKPATGAVRPSVGTPVGAKPSVGTPVKPQVGTPVGAKPTVGTPKPVVGTPVGTPRPVVGTPVGTPRPQIGTPVGSRPQVGTKPQVVTPSDAAKPDTTPAPETPAKVETKPTVGLPMGSRPRVGTPKKDDEEKTS